jgi:hypothetical protein
VLNSANQFPVSYFDKQFGEHRTYMMYVEPEEMAKIYNVGASVIGVLDYEVSFVGTLNDLQKFSITYMPQYWDGNSVVELSYKDSNFSDLKTYQSGDITYWNGSYYKAIFKETSFSGVAPPAEKYWQWQNKQAFSELANYRLGDIVYLYTSGNGELKTIYYQAQQDNFSGASVDNKEFWKEVSVSPYSAEKTYSIGDLVEGADSGIYKAIYYNETFSGISPNNVKYWAKDDISTKNEVSWGSSIKIATASDFMSLFELPVGKEFKGWNTRVDGFGLKLLPNSNWTVFEDTKIYPILE